MHRSARYPFIARREVGETGHVFGVDFTPEMVEKARANAAALGFDNVQFEHGDIEALPVADDSMDVVVSNCVLNLVPDKPRAFAEMLRVVRPGGHFCVSDVVSRGALPDAVRASAELYAGWRGIIRQNLWMSLGMVVFLVPATIFGLGIGPAVALHEGSTLLVVFNALRLLAYRDPTT